MNETSSAESRRDGIVTALGILILAVGTATGSAYLLLGMSAAALVLFVVCFPESSGRKSLMAVCGAGLAAATVAVLLTIW